MTGGAAGAQAGGVGGGVAGGSGAVAGAGGAAAGSGGSGGGGAGSGGSGAGAGGSAASAGSAGSATGGGAGATGGTGGDAGGEAGKGGSGGSGVTCGASPAAAHAVLGFATQGGATTGGGNATPETPSNLASALSGDSAKVIRFSGTKSVSNLEIGSNTTLEGMGATATIEGGISIDGKQNVILRNFRLNAANSDAGEDGINIQGSSRIWIDHLEIYDGADGNLDITNGCDFITVSWTKFRYSGSGDHRFVNLIGSDDDDSGNYRVTFHHNWWATNSMERMPRVRFGQVHVFNNYYGTGTNTNLNNDHCIRAGYESDVRVESNYFDRVNTPHEVAEDDGTGVLSATVCANNTSAGSPAGCNIEYLSLNTDDNPSSRGTAFTPPYTYANAMEPADCVKATVMANAGPQ
jgi:pectate lyase